MVFVAILCFLYLVSSLKNSFFSDLICFYLFSCFTFLPVSINPINSQIVLSNENLQLDKFIMHLTWFSYILWICLCRCSKFFLGFLNFSSRSFLVNIKLRFSPFSLVLIYLFPSIWFRIGFSKSCCCCCCFFRFFSKYISQ